MLATCEPETPGRPVRETRDSLFAGQLTLSQHADGYRFDIDALLLAGAVRLPPRARVLDLGAGCGVVGLALAFWHIDCRLMCIEVQPSMSNLCRRNIERNGMSERATVIHADVREPDTWRGSDPWDVAVCNPPYFPAKAGRLNPNPERARARHELAGGLDAFLAGARGALIPRGRLYLIYPAFRLEPLAEALSREGFRLEWFQPVQAHPDQPASRLLVCARLGGAARLVFRPPIVTQRGSHPSRWVEELLSGHKPTYPGETPRASR